VKSRQEKKLKEEIGPFLEEGEEVRAVLIARPRGWTQSSAGVEAIGGRQEQKAHAGAEEAGIRLASPGGLVLTNKRLLSVQITDVDSIKVRRLLLGYVVTLTVRGSEFKLEANAAAGAKPMAKALEQAKAEA
jgi:hypothetical protein